MRQCVDKYFALQCETGCRSQRGKGGVNVSDRIGEVKCPLWLETVESALYSRFLSKLDEGRFDECHKIIGLLEGLGII